MKTEKHKVYQGKLGRDGQKVTGVDVNAQNIDVISNYYTKAEFENILALEVSVHLIIPGSQLFIWSQKQLQETGDLDVNTEASKVDLVKAHNQIPVTEEDII